MKQDSFLVDTLNCKIPNLDPWADSIKSHFSKISKPVQDCRKFKKWTFTVGNVNMAISSYLDIIFTPLYNNSVSHSIHLNF